MGIRFHCNFCERRLNVKATQAGEFCFCPDCENEILIPLESTVELAKKRKKKRRGKQRKSNVGLSPTPVEANSIELGPVVAGDPVVQSPVVEVPIVEVPIVEVPVVESPVVEEPVVEEPVVEEPVVEEPIVEEPIVETPVTEIPADELLVVGEAVDADAPAVAASAPASEIVASTQTESVEAQSVETQSLSAEEACTVDPQPVSADETMTEQASLDDSTPEASFGDEEQLDSEAALDQLLSSDEREIPDDNSSESESFLLAKPVAKIGDDPLKASPDLVWYLRHKRLGEKGPLRARQVEEMLEAGQIRAGFIVWREDWNDWVPAEEVFPNLAQPQDESPAYEIPEELNPHSEASRKRRSQKRFWMCFNAAAFLLVLVLVYWMTQFGSS